MSLRRQRHRLPVEPAFEQQRPAGIARALIVVLEFALQPLELRVGQHRALRPRIDQRAGGPRRVVEQRLVPARRGVVRVDRDGGGFQRRQPVVIVERMEQREMQDRRQRPRSGRSARCGPPTVYS